ncbi:MAG: hypothetical protein KME60_12555 [Cyanomargarita calcarea GSE-NOS-MK-12-04C]|jgi:hypothetical protein|uniref:Uncharacterized protein n=1 Tax=Cyanomargarita calcarea GSE-NOS-MK-12-04C TaxID=2839659 RepID=A0A951QMK0_9CYAN|nr:hypothetical protein [Cyanomargarita calcarea GSE-NOS-MK-12-04C]
MSDQTFDKLIVNDRVGIGTERPEPDTQLHISPTGKDGKIYLESGGNLLQVIVNSTIATIGTSGSFPLQLQANLNQSKFSGIYISNNGNVGIGTTSPSFNLDIQGTINATQFNKNDKLWKITDDDIDDNTISGIKIKDGTISKDKLNFSITPGTNQWAGDSSSISYSGKVGIGTTTPNFDFDVQGTKGIINAKQFYKNGSPWIISRNEIASKAINADKIDDGAVSDIKIANNAVTRDKIADKSISKEKLDFSITPGSSQWQGADGGPISYTKGSVGIGTDNPQDKLHLAGNLRILTDSNPIRFTSAWSGFPDLAINQAEISNDTGTFKTLMIVGNKSAGGVRRVSVWDKLEVNGAIIPKAGNLETAGIMFPKDPGGGSGDAAWIRYYRRGDSGEATTFEIGTSNDPDDHIALMPSLGNVGIGTIQPQGKLDVNGGILAKNVQVRNSDNQGVVGISVNVESCGYIETRNSKNNVVTQINTITNTQDGIILVRSGDGEEKIRLEGNGNIFTSGNISCNAIYAKVKPFLIDHPEDETKNIVYAAIEGPECAAYIRGKAKLNCGQAEVAFPDHFSVVVNPTTITIQLTPRSAESKGLAVLEQSEDGFLVKELWQGEGNYEFDYFVAGVRKGLENFTPVVTKGFSAFAMPGTEAGSLSAVSLQPAAIAQVAKYEENS